MYVMESALGPPGRVLAAVFALAASWGSLGMGGMVQSKAAAEALESAFGVPAGLTGLAAAVLALGTLLRGGRGVARACERLVPAMAVSYFLCALAVILGNWRSLPGALEEIVLCAFTPRAAAGGAAGTAISVWDAARWGVARGVFSNEAGTGAAGIAAASADSDSPARQGYINMAGVFFDTIVLCTATGLAICASGVLETAGGAEGGTLTIRAFGPGADQLVPDPLRLLHHPGLGLPGGAGLRLSLRRAGADPLPGRHGPGGAGWGEGGPGPGFPAGGRVQRPDVPAQSPLSPGALRPRGPGAAGLSAAQGRLLRRKGPSHA